jgi:hypothetical protein
MLPFSLSHLQHSLSQQPVAHRTKVALTTLWVWQSCSLGGARTPQWQAEWKHTTVCKTKYFKSLKSHGKSLSDQVKAQLMLCLGTTRSLQRCIHPHNLFTTSHPHIFITPGITWAFVGALSLGEGGEVEGSCFFSPLQICRAQSSGFCSEWAAKEWKEIKELDKRANFCWLQQQLKATYQPGMVVHTCNPSYSGGGGRRIEVWGWPG